MPPKKQSPALPSENDRWKNAARRLLERSPTDPLSTNYRVLTIEQFIEEMREKALTDDPDM